jgi:hypothetical protein
MAKPPAVDAVLAQLDNLSSEDLQLVIQTANSIQQDLTQEPEIPPKVIMSLSKKLDEIRDLKVTIPIQLQFQLQADLRYAGPGDQVEILGVTAIESAGKSNIPLDTILDMHGDIPETIVADILDDLWAGPDEAESTTRAKKLCPSLVQHSQQVKAFEKELDDVVKKFQIDIYALFDEVEFGSLPKKGKKKAGKKRLRMSF